jgi:putative membrane protein
MLLLSTITLRPYVFIFLLVYLVGCTLQFGLKRALLFCISGYFIAWLSELSSIHNSFPYGIYYYLEQTRGQEIWVLGVPLMDSISYVFLAYASYSLSVLIVSPVCRSDGLLYVLETIKTRSSWYTTLLATLLFVYLDIIIDPVALQGSRWFLGQIYGYQEPGLYFGVPISNFFGWFVVGCLMIATWQKIDQWLHRRNIPDYYGYRYPWRYLIGPGLYAGVLVFNLSVTFFINENMMGWVGVFIVLLPAFLVCTLVRIKLSTVDLEKSQEAHRKDFPQAVIYPS